MRLGHSHNVIGASLMRLASNAGPSSRLPPQRSGFALATASCALDNRCQEGTTVQSAMPDPIRSALKPLILETRAKREVLRSFVRSTPDTLVEEIRRRHRQVLVRKVCLIFLALALGASLSGAHFVCGVPLMRLAWGATAIALIAVFGMAQIWSHTARQQARLHRRISSARRNIRLRPSNSAMAVEGFAPR